jgi:hypothetical protein
MIDERRAHGLPSTMKLRQLQSMGFRGTWQLKNLESCHSMPTPALLVALSTIGDDLKRADGVYVWGLAAPGGF